jgi:hypothetical protein
MSKQMAPLSLRLTVEQKERLEAAAGRIGISAHALAQLAILAGIESIEKNQGRIAMPLEFTTTHEVVPKARGSTSYPSREESYSTAAEMHDKPRRKRKAA